MPLRCTSTSFSNSENSDENWVFSPENTYGGQQFHEASTTFWGPALDPPSH
jgi:hypothetical protein